MRLFSTERKSSLIPPAVPGDATAQETQPSPADEKLRQRRQRLNRLHSMDAATFHDRSAYVDGVEVPPGRPPNSPQSPRSPPPASPKSAGRRPHSAKSRHGSSSSSSSSKPVSPTEPPRSPVSPESAKSLPTPSPPPLLATKSHDRDAPAAPLHPHHGKKKHLATSKSLPAESPTSPQSPHPLATSPPHASRPHKPAAAADAAAAGGKKLKRKKAKKKDNDTATKVDYIVSYN